MLVNCRKCDFSSRKLFLVDLNQKQIALVKYSFDTAEGENVLDGEHGVVNKKVVPRLFKHEHLVFMLI